MQRPKPKRTVFTPPDAAARREEQRRARTFQAEEATRGLPPGLRKAEVLDAQRRNSKNPVDVQALRWRYVPKARRAQPGPERGEPALASSTRLQQQATAAEIATPGGPAPPKVVPKPTRTVRKPKPKPRRS